MALNILYAAEKELHVIDADILQAAHLRLRLFRLLWRIKYFCAWEATCRLCKYRRETRAWDSGEVSARAGKRNSRGKRFGGRRG